MPDPPNHPASSDVERRGFQHQLRPAAPIECEALESQSKREEHRSKPVLDGAGQELHAAAAGKSMNFSL